MSFSMRTQREANQHASLSNKFGLCHLSARYCNIGYSFSSMDDCSLKTMQLRGFHPAFLCPHRKLLVRFSTLVKTVVRKCVVQKACMAHLNENAAKISLLFSVEDVCLFWRLSCIPLLHRKTKAKMCVDTGFLWWWSENKRKGMISSAAHNVWFWLLWLLHANSPS